MMPLDRNESYWLLGDELGKVVRLSGTKELSTYPDYNELKQALAAYAGVESEQIVVTPGSDAAIEHVARMCVEEGREVVLPVPTFYGYESILERVGARVTPLFYEEQGGQFVFPLEKTLEALKDGTPKVIFLCEPNNPLGCPLSVEDMSALVRAAKDSSACVVSDEAYFEFSSGRSFLPFLSELPNLIVIRTLSKSFALSGARVGYGIAASQLVKKLEKYLLPWPVAHPSVSMALSLLARADEVLMRRKLVITERDNLIESLRAMPTVITYPSETNFVLLRAPNAERVRTGLLAQGVRVAVGEPMTRFIEAKALLKDTLRVAIPAPESRANFLTILGGVLH